MIVRAVLRIVSSVTVLVAVYYFLPLEHFPARGAVTILLAGLAVFPKIIVGVVSHRRQVPQQADQPDQD
jgi:hypothetical protein